MPSPSQHRTAITREAVRRFYHLPERTIARHLIANHGDLYNNNLEIARSAVRRVMGTNGEQNRAHTAPDLFRTGAVAMPQTWRRERTEHKLPVGLWLVLADIHIPFHEPKPLETAISWGQAQGVDGVLLNGDAMDCKAVSAWPTAQRDFDRELEAMMDFLDFLRCEFPVGKGKKPGKKIVYKPGNHEYRLPRYFVCKAPDLATSPLAAMETVCGFEHRQIEFLDYYQMVRAGKLPVFHGHEFGYLQKMVNPARGLFLRAKSFALCSHCHSTSEHPARDVNGLLMTTWSTGCLCDLSPDYNPYGNDWNWGAAIIDVQKGGFEVENRRILPNGKLA